MKAIYKFKKELFLTLAIALSSCNVLDVDPEHVMAPENFYETKDEVVYGLAGVYGVLNSEAVYGNYYSLMMSNTDDLCYQNRSQNGSYTYWYTHTSSNSHIYQTWSKLYEGIKNANEFMSAIKDNEFDEDGKFFAEARFMRAYYHFILAQTWGDVPLRNKAVSSPSMAEIAATPQVEVLQWCANEMKATLDTFSEYDVTSAPSRVSRSTIQGILARVYLFLAGESVKGVEDKAQMWADAAYYAGEVIGSGVHALNPSYSQVFINMISDTYDKSYFESMWEAEFTGNHSAGSWSNGRIGDLIGLQSTSSNSKFSEWNCNYSYAWYNGTLKLWDLYWTMDRTTAEDQSTSISDTRQEWNLPNYNYAGSKSSALDKVYVASYDKTPYVYENKSSFVDLTVGAGQRNAGKFRRESEYEGSMTAKDLYTHINFPILRYSDVLLMYAEAINESEGNYQAAYNAVKEVRDRAQIETKNVSEYSSKEAMRELVRNERGRELAFESLRKYDLIRWGTFVKEMNGFSKWTNDARWSLNATAERYAAIAVNVQEKHIVQPIPSIELGVNKLLKQNALW